MSASSPMKCLYSRYGERSTRWGPRSVKFAVYWASRRVHLFPGVLVWWRGRHWRVLPIPATREARRYRRQNPEVRP